MSEQVAHDTNPAVFTAQDSDTATKVKDLNAGWRNFIADTFGMDKNTFQLAQGNLGLQTSDNSGLFRMADAVPPPSAIGFYDPSSMVSRAQNIGSLLVALLPESNPNALTTALGNYYTDWVNWSTNPANRRQAGQTYLQWFQAWELQSAIDPGTSSRAEAAIRAGQNTPLNKASDAFYDPKYQQTFSVVGAGQYTLYMYSGTTNAAQTAINNGEGANISFSTESMDTSVSNTFVEGAASGFYDIFSGSVGGSFNQLNSKAAGSSMTITGRIGKYATLQTGPGGWYPSNEVKRALAAPGDNTVWDPGASAGNWNAFFGQPNGSLARSVSQLLLVTDYSITVTSKATYSQEDYQQIKTQATFGIWPFFSASASATHTTDVQLNSDSTISTTFTLPNGSIQIWGVTVQPISS
jgi:hypothetical protein